MADTTFIRMVSRTEIRHGDMYALWNDLQPFGFTYHGNGMFLCFPAKFLCGIPTEATIHHIRNWADWYLEQIGDNE